MGSHLDVELLCFMKESVVCSCSHAQGASPSMKIHGTVLEAVLFCVHGESL